MSLIVIIIYCLFAIVMRVAFIYRLTGSYGIENAKTSIKPNLYYIICLYIGFYGMIFLAILDFFNILKPQLYIHVNSVFIALLLALIGLGVTISGQHQMGKSWRVIVAKSEHTKLITHGLFKYSRNPIYLGTLILFFSTVILFPHVLMLICFLFAYLSIELLVRFDEEPHLKKVHGIEYENFCEKVNRFFPKIF